MAYSGCAFSWVSGFSGKFFPYLFGTFISEGQCLPLMLFPSQSDRMVYMWFTYLYYFQLPLLMFVVCYARIFQVIRHQNRIFQEPSQDTAVVVSSAAATAAYRKSWRRQVNVVKTMIFITTFFAVSWMPNYVYFVISMTTSSTFILPLWYATVFMALFNIFANPFIYIVSYDDVRDYFNKKFAESLHTST
jgi:hypothetical protein